MPKLSAQEQSEFLNERRVIMKIAAVKPDGSPFVTPVWYLCEHGAIYFTPREQSDWFGYLRNDPRVALCIDEQPLPYRKVLIDGGAELLHDVGEDDAWRDLYLRLSARYIPQRDAEAYVRNTLNEPRGLFRVVLADAKVRSWRLPVDGEASEGIWHKRYYKDPNIDFSAKQGSSDD